jgi:hypothetical protein
MIYVVGDFNRVQAVVRLPDGADIDALRDEFEAVVDPGPNPYRYNTPTQDEWAERSRHREEYLVGLYGGERDYGQPGRRDYGPLTFVGWLVKEKGARRIRFTEFCMAEFD